jgi:hypothetical protein
VAAARHRTSGPTGESDADDLFFISYSHADAQWVQRFTVLLKPLVRRNRLTMWADPQLRAGINGVRRSRWR